MDYSYNIKAVYQPIDIKNTFDLFAEDFDNWFVENKEIYLSELNTLLAAKPSGRVLDIGVGSGVFAFKLGVELGIDISSSMLKKSKERGIDVVQADVNALPIRSESFDTVLVSFTICFVNSVENMLKEISRVLKCGSSFVLGEITKDSVWGKKYSELGKGGHRFYSKATFYTYKQTKRMLLKSGFELIRVYGTLDFSPDGEPFIESPTDLRPDDYTSIKTFGFIVIVSSKSC
ncbi:MAG: methyltransferase domain-containing protein [Conexivisphaerales archaeon]